MQQKREWKKSKKKKKREAEVVLQRALEITDSSAQENDMMEWGERDELKEADEGDKQRHDKGEVERLGKKKKKT